jgi:hypothetical protein
VFGAWYPSILHDLRNATLNIATTCNFSECVRWLTLTTMVTWQWHVVSDWLCYTKSPQHQHSSVPHSVSQLLNDISCLQVCIHSNPFLRRPNVHSMNLENSLIIYKRPSERQASPRSTDLPDKLRVGQLFKNVPALYGTQKFISVFTKSRHWSLIWCNITLWIRSPCR